MKKYYKSYNKIKGDYLVLDKINQVGNGGIYDFLSNNAQNVCNLAVRTISSSVTNCDIYYNKTNKGEYTTYYEFPTMDQLHDFLNYVYNLTIDYNRDTILYELKKNDPTSLPLPELVKLFMNSKLSKAKILEVIFSKKDVEKYTKILNKTMVSDAKFDNAIKSFIEVLPGHVLDSIKNTLYIETESKYTENIWDAYSIFLSFIACLMDSYLVTCFVPINDIKQRLHNLDLPVIFVYLDLLLDKKFGKSPGTRNVNDLYNNYMKDKNIVISPEKKKEIIINRRADYDKINDFTINDFLDPKKNTLCCLPPSVLFMLLIKINPNINKKDNNWNKMMKQNLKYLRVSCEKKTEAVPSSQKEEKKPTMTNEEKERIGQLQKEYEEVKQAKLNHACQKNVIFKIDFNKIMNFLGKKYVKKCEAYYVKIKRMKEIELQIANIKNTEEVPSGTLDRFKEFAFNQLMKAIDVDIITNAICENSIQWNIFDKMFKHVIATRDVFIQLTGSKTTWYINIIHGFIQLIAGFVTFLPIDLKKVLQIILHIEQDKINDFDNIYDFYRFSLYKNFTEKPDDNYYLNEKTPETSNPLFPPKQLLDNIKQQAIGNPLQKNIKM